MQSAVFVCSWISGKFSQAVNYWKVQMTLIVKNVPCLCWNRHFS